MLGDVEDTVMQAVNATEEAKAQDGKVVVCLCGTWAAEKDATRCPGCGKTIKNL